MKRLDLFAMVACGLGQPAACWAAEPFARGDEGAKRVVEGVGWRGFRIGATRAELVEAYGPLETSPGGVRKGWFTRRHIDCWFDQAGQAVEIRFMQGFTPPLASGVRIGSPEKDVLLAYGSPDRVVNQPNAKMLEYPRRGVLLWLQNGKVFSFTVLRPTEAAPPASQDRLADQQKKARERMRRDARVYSADQRQEIESLYQVANSKWRTQEARDSLQTLVEKYKEANRTGCAILYLGQMSHGRGQIRYFREAIADHSDCFYGDGAQVGAIARFLLGQVYLRSGETEEATRLFDEIRRDYPDSVDHQGRSLVEQLPRDENRTSPARTSRQSR